MNIPLAAVHALLEAGDVAADLRSHATTFQYRGRWLLLVYSDAASAELTRRGFVPVTESCRVFEPPAWAFKPMLTESGEVAR